MFLKKVHAVLNKTVMNSNSWEFLPEKVKQILHKRGYGKTSFTANAHPIAPKGGFAILRAKPGFGGSYLSVEDLKAISDTGVLPVINEGVLTFHLDHESFHDVKKEAQAKKDK